MLQVIIFTIRNFHNMSEKIAQVLHHQNAPAVLIRFPWLLHLYFWINHFSVLRMKYARRAILQTIRRIGIPKRIVDAGCGLGDFIFTISEFKRAEQIVGIDVSSSNIELCRQLSNSEKKKNIQFICGDLKNTDIPPQQDLILCIALLMYIQDDTGILKKFNDALALNGRLILYVPVNYRRSLSIYKRLSKIPGFDYDDTIGRPQTYTSESIEQRLVESGFHIEEKRHSFGTAASTAFEISSIFEWYIKKKHPISLIFSIPLYILFYPVYVLIMMIDFRTTRDSGNGLLIIAHKKQ